MMTWVIGGMAALLVTMGAVVVGLLRRVQQLEASTPRVARLGEAVTLLSETAEAGFAAVAQEIEKLQRAPGVRAAAPRATVSKRVVKAATRGESVEQIARREDLSEGEVRLHLALAETAPLVRKGGRRAVVRA